MDFVRDCGFHRQFSVRGLCSWLMFLAYVHGYGSDGLDFRKRAKEKVDKAVEEYEEEEREKRLGPGGLDPVEVFESLPEELQKCFESQVI